MTDGQDLFDPSPYFSTNPYIDGELQRQLRRGEENYGSWRLNRQLDTLIGAGALPPLIVVGIASDDGRRTSEYSPWPWSDEPHPAGEAFADFLVGILKPLIEQSYRVRRGREHAALLGSSMGGLIALYTAFRHPHSFARVAALSPVLSPRVVGDRLSRHILAARAPPMRVYADLGDRETGFGPLTSLAAALSEAGGHDYWLRRISGGRHRIVDWRARVGEVLRWLWR